MNRSRAVFLFVICVGFSSLRFCFITDFGRMSLANLQVLKTIAPHGVDQRFLYPMGECSQTIVNRSVISFESQPYVSPHIAGIVFLRSGDWNQAEWYFKEALSRGWASITSGYALGVARILAGKEPISDWKRAGAAQRMLSVARQCLLEGNVNVASDYYRMALETISPVDLVGSRQLVLFFASTKDDVALVRALEKYLSLAAINSPDYYRTMGQVYLLRERPAQALEHFMALVQFSPSDKDAWYLAGRAALALEDYDQARSCFTQAIRLDYAYPDYYIYIGHSFLYQRQYDLAADWYERALGIDPENSWALTSLAQVRMEQARYGEVLDLALRAMHRDRRAHVPALAAKAALQMGEWQQAKQLIGQALSQDPQNSTYLLQQGQICELARDWECAKQSYQSVLKIDATHSLAQDRLERLKGGGR